MATKKITDVDVIDSLNSDESFFVNQNSSIKQINKSNIVFGITNGGTGATTVSGARNALGLGNTDGALPVANGGTGATTADNARVNLGITPKNIGAVTMKSAIATLNSDSWDENNLSCFINVDGVTVDNIVIVSPEPTTSNYEVYNRYGVYCASQEDNRLMFLCKKVPSSDIDINIVIFE